MDDIFRLVHGKKSFQIQQRYMEICVLSASCVWMINTSSFYTGYGKHRFYNGVFTLTHLQV